MEISGKILREVEFRDRLRGYDTDEVDEFLEKVAAGIDELREAVTSANSRADRAERQFETIPPADDDSIRRTLVLAQRTADLAISEAREEATALMDQARAQSDALLAEARTAAQAMRSDAERDLAARVQHLAEEHDRLTRQISVLTSLVEGERGRITDSISSLLHYVDEALSVPPAVAEAAELPGLTEAPKTDVASFTEDDLGSEDLGGDAFDGGAFARSGAAEAGGASSGGLFDGGFDRDEDPLDLGLPDVEAEIADDAALAFGARRELSPEAPAPAELDPDEELWSRWANSAESGEGATDPNAEPFRFGRRNEDDNPS